MDAILTQSSPATEGEYKAACAELLLEMKQHEETFDKLQTEIEAMQEAAGRRAIRSAALTEEMHRMMNKLWGPK